MTPSDPLGQVPLFRRLRSEHLAAIMRAATNATYSPGEEVLHQGQTGQALYVLLSGAAESRSVPPEGQTGQIKIAKLTRGDYFGETAVLEPAPSNATVTITEPSELLVLTQVQLVAEMRRDPELAIAIARRAGRLARGDTEPHEAEELRQLRAQMLLYAGDLKRVYDEERSRARQLSDAMMDTIRVLINAIESKDPRHVGHGGRVARYSQSLALHIGWDEERAVQAAIGGLIHDIGQVSLPDELVRKDGPLTRREIEEMRRHPELGARLLRGISSLEPLLPYVLYHHENWDGTGFPERRKSIQIPIEARVVAVADAFDEIRARVPGSEEAATEEAFKELRRQGSTRLDPDLLGAFGDAYRAGKVTV